MTELRCPFSFPLVKGLAHCSHAEEVVRRGGSEFDCRSASSHSTCMQVFGGLKAEGLPAFGVEDDVMAMPHSVLVKVQAGGLAGLRRILEDTQAGCNDIGHLVVEVARRYGSVDRIPFSRLTGDMTSFKLERRSRRR